MVQRKSRRCGPPATYCGAAESGEDDDARITGSRQFMTGDTADRIRGTDAHGSTYVRSIVHCGIHAILATWD